MIEKVILISLFCNGIYIASDAGMILFPLNKLFVKLIGGKIHPTGDTELNTIQKYIYKPFFGCLPCMASVWGSLAYLLLYQFQLTEYLIIIGAVAALNRITYGLIIYLEHD